jgi:hypothetical protein
MSEMVGGLPVDGKDPELFRGIDGRRSDGVGPSRSSNSQQCRSDSFHAWMLWESERACEMEGRKKGLEGRRRKRVLEMKTVT